ncbi:MAG: hypothetical protein QGH83_10975 [Candidatus Pacebacteria bacterium]|jgi:hypothetical protein|nr:hypothetical protein [Candidatus Paceibacterota bacterium]|tara:strand:+ start:243 stop:413 length:171 start_codon:yes stop_codon:yes gene_type:complete
MSREFVDAMSKGDNLEAEAAFKSSIVSKVGDTLERTRKGLANTFVKTMKVETEADN